MQALGIALALASAAVWGAGDFLGGLASRRTGHCIAHARPVRHRDAGGAGRTAASRSRPPRRHRAASLGYRTVGLACLYRGLALGHTAMVAPTAAVITAALPVIFAWITEGRPRGSQLSGFVVAMAGIWLVAAPAKRIDVSRSGFRLALLAGVGFGGFLILIGQVPSGSVFVPAAVSRAMMFAAVVVLLRTRGLALPALTSNPAALVAGLFDAGGNVFYLYAKEYARLDVAAVLSSLYPVTTVLLAHAVLKEKVSRFQWIGMGVCLLAVALITI